MSFQLKRREKGPPVDCANISACGATDIYGFEVQHTNTNCWYAVCVDCARKMAEHPANVGEYVYEIDNPNEFTEAVTKGGA